MNPRRIFILRLAISLSLSFPVLCARADIVGYNEVFDCTAESAQFIARHHHDWSDATSEARWKMISTDKNVFTEQNTYSILRVIDRGSETLRFQVPVPALRHIWISPDSRFIVGISDIKAWNPIQLVVYNAEGSLLLAKQVTYSSFPGVQESVTNWVHWYKMPAPSISIEAGQPSYTLAIEGNNGEMRKFHFKDSK